MSITIFLLIMLKLSCETIQFQITNSRNNVMKHVYGLRTILSRNWIRDLTTMTKSFKIILTTSGENKLEIETTEIPDYQCHTFITLRTVTRFEHTLFLRPLILILKLYDCQYMFHHINYNYHSIWLYFRYSSKYF